MSRGVERRPIFADDADRQFFISLLLKTKEECDFRIFAYCLMGNHFHIVVQVHETPLHRGMHRILTLYSRHFNVRQDRKGHLFQSRYTARLCRQDAYLGALLRYVHLNPVRAGLALTPAEWCWSGHRGLSGISPDPILDVDTVAEYLGTAPSDLPSLYLGVLAGTAGGVVPDPETVPREERKTLGDIAESVAQDYGLSAGDLLSGGRGARFTEAKRTFVLAARARGHLMKAAAAALRCSPSAASQLLSRKN